MEGRGGGRSGGRGREKEDGEAGGGWKERGGRRRRWGGAWSVLVFQSRRWQALLVLWIIPMIALEGVPLCPRGVMVV